jgi:hypothetical protein
MSLTLTATLGVEWSAFRSTHTLTIELTDADLTDGFDPNDVFTALNRIESLDTDVNAMSKVWMRHLRIALDEVGAPSMSVGDTFTITDRHGAGTAFRVARRGFDITPNVAAAGLL